MTILVHIAQRLPRTLELIGKAGHQYDSEARLQDERFLGETYAVELRHINVGDQDIERSAVRAERLKCLDAVLGDVNGVAVGAQRPPDEIAHRGVIVCEQDRRHVAAPLSNPISQS